MNSAIDKIIKENNLFFCIDCGKCVSSCPLAKAREDFSPRVIVERALFNLSLVEDRELWFCLTCEACTRRCPSNVRINVFVEAVRSIATERNRKEYSLCCERCGRYFMTKPISDYCKKLTKETEISEASWVLCPRCKRREVAEKFRLK